MKKKQIWVYPQYAKKLKKEAIEKDLTVLQLTKKIGEREGQFHEWQKVKPKKKEDKRKWFTI